MKHFKMLSGSFPIFALSNHITFSQTQTVATVPLKMEFDFFCNLLKLTDIKISWGFLTIPAP
jgi:hypothetical protein